jgi:indolepyruvate ferredoxin oxidoreductase beta subunit
MGFDEPALLITRWPCALKKMTQTDVEEFGSLRFVNRVIRKTASDVEPVFKQAARQSNIMRIPRKSPSIKFNAQVVIYVRRFVRNTPFSGRKSKMSEVKNILLCGVGGQGTILASKILSTALVAAGYDVKMSEIHGMSQRGGSVVTQVRYGDKVYSPIIGKGSADILVSFEAMEALRYLNGLKKDGVAVVNDYRLPTATTLSGQETYPADCIERLKTLVNTKVLDAAKIATELGNPKSMNIVLLGALIQLMKLEALDWDKAIADNIKPRFAAINRKALDAGIAAVAE